ncbi:hypothetical protein SAMN05216582_105121 [Selenomonas ruminantium]|uniref:Uncharacterized protein n=1 Tax=Selenomonas ruminantium TaxID=971 RepID=A0A1M6SWP0_SELRU|nr:hypothetical protein [Selenomonas ruminantium]SHK49141.1 hypothetical protein SAMN05216582_105121 [Selenomonas ruminantium]
MEFLDKAGLVYDNIVVKLHSGQLEVMGIARMYGVGVNGERGPLGEKYRGKRSAPLTLGRVPSIPYIFSGMKKLSGLASVWLSDCGDL